MASFLRFLAYSVIVGMLYACSSAPLHSHTNLPDIAASTPASNLPAMEQSRSRWIPVDWSDLPGFEEDSLFEIWNAWIKSCERPHSAHARLCPQIRQLSIANTEQQRQWIQAQLQPYRVQTPEGQTEGLLTGYFEPILKAQRANLGTPARKWKLYRKCKKH
jgi:membrane-bound lytic murein transglycosylase A